MCASVLDDGWCVFDTHMWHSIFSGHLTLSTTLHSNKFIVKFIFFYENISQFHTWVTWCVQTLINNKVGLCIKDTNTHTHTLTHTIAIYIDRICIFIGIHISFPIVPSVRPHIRCLITYKLQPPWSSSSSSFVYIASTLMLLSIQLTSIKINSFNHCIHHSVSILLPGCEYGCVSACLKLIHTIPAHIILLNFIWIFSYLSLYLALSGYHGRG